MQGLVLIQIHSASRKVPGERRLTALAAVNRRSALPMAFRAWP